ncbi:MFS-type transporter SLC18B1-like isoform X3 [Sitophilus oryzae]|uniref:MFS-type transporter SLC18B1-like isoform X3 n=1 Tax=Sitophilus oryzae TaxID=7048 RepID=A0A6J2YQA2_SITOR|nr:MFS-type transporter SLC18B1-like isoform X3 [Sitophilus oryzae]
MDGFNDKKEVYQVCEGKHIKETTSSLKDDGLSIDLNRKKNRFTCRQKVSLAILAAADFICFCSMSIMSPFYPAIATKKGMTDTMSGLVFGFYALVMFLSSPVIGKVLPKVGAKNIFIYGLFVSGTSSIIFGLLDKIESYTPFVILSFLIRGMEALGSSAYSTASYVLIINIFPDHAGAVRGLLETFVGLGLSAGPAVGGVLFTVGGFGLSFYVVGVATILIAFLNIYLLANPEKNDLEKSGSLLNLLKLPSVLITCLIIIISSMTSSFLEPTLEPHLRKFNLTPSQVGLMFLFLTASYGIFSPIIGWLTDKLNNYSWLMTSSLLCSSVVLLFLGPSPIFSQIKDSIWLNIVVLIALGILIAMSLMPTYQYILDSSMENGFHECLGTHSVIAGLWSSVYSLGEVVGPVLGGVLMQHFGFPTLSTTFAIINFVAGVITLIYFRSKRSKSIEKVPNKKGEDNVVFYLEATSTPVVEDISICSRL